MKDKLIDLCPICEHPFEQCQCRYVSGGSFYICEKTETNGALGKGKFVHRSYVSCCQIPNLIFEEE